MERTLGPRNVGDILKETFIIYKNNFWRLAAIISIVAVPGVIISLTFNLLSPGYGGMAPEHMATSIILMLILLPLALASAVANILMRGAVIHGVSQQYFNWPINIGRAYSFAWRRFGAILGAVLLVGLVIFGILVGIVLVSVIIAIALGGASKWLTVMVMTSMVFIAIVACAYFAIKWVFVLQTALFEGCGSTGAMSYSSALVSQNWWRVFGIILLFYVITAAIVGIFYAPAMISYLTWSLSGIMTGSTIGATAHPPAWVLIAMPIGALISSIVAGPIFATGQTLLYFDLRVRKQGYNLDALANELGLSSTTIEQAPSPPG